ncbi:hypothetical protein [Bdellovibrio sp.]|uniref:hypothetical protein n=1 Tax=Bdellovibrio sp. TaxID=28201 RepID=UPI003221CADA
MTLKVAPIFILCLLLGACAFKKDDGKGPSSATTNTDVIESVEKVSFTGELNDQNVKITFLEDEEPGLYQLEISWPANVPAMKVSIDGEAYKIIKNSNKHSVFINHSMKAKVHIVALNALGGESSTFAAEVTSPVDLLIDKPYHIQEDSIIKTNRLYILKDGLFITNGFNLTLDTKTLIVHSEISNASNRMQTRDAQILTTAPKNVAPTLRFLVGSQINIKAQKAVGHLRVAMVGFNGIDGKAGANGAPGKAGKNGRDGAIKDFTEYCVNDDGRPCRGASQIDCTSNPTNGEQGTPGSLGQQGESGSTGGNSGVLTAIIDDHTQFKLEVGQRRGLGGRGGAGGKGGPGGPGGAPGDNPFNKCRNAFAGPQGATGPDGKSGQDGKAGLLDDVITNVSNFSRYEIE